MNRRGFLSGLLFTPAIIRTPGLLMAIKPPLTCAQSLWLVGRSSMPFDLSPGGVVYGALAPGEFYGRSPAMDVLAEMRAMNATDEASRVAASAAHVRRRLFG